jgi:hypothetical protein
MQRNKIEDLVTIEKHYELTGIDLDLLKKIVNSIDQMINHKKLVEVHSADFKMNLERTRKKTFKLKIITESDNYEDVMCLEELKSLFFAAPFVNYLL